MDDSRLANKIVSNMNAEKERGTFNSFPKRGIQVKNELSCACICIWIHFNVEGVITLYAS